MIYTKSGDDGFKVGSEDRCATFSTHPVPTPLDAVRLRHDLVKGALNRKQPMESIQISDVVCVTYFKGVFTRIYLGG